MKLLDGYIDDLRQLQSVDFAEYTENKFIHRTVERTLHLAIEACLDIGRHIISQERFRTPEDNKDVFVILYEESIIASELLEKLIAMAGFRNIIVHSYARIEHEIVFAILSHRLEDFDRFARHIVRYLQKD